MHRIALAVASVSVVIAVVFIALMPTPERLAVLLAPPAPIDHELGWLRVSDQGHSLSAMFHYDSGFVSGICMLWHGPSPDRLVWKMSISDSQGQVVFESLYHGTDGLPKTNWYSDWYSAVARITPDLKKRERYTIDIRVIEAIPAKPPVRMLVRQISP